MEQVARPGGVVASVGQWPEELSAMQPTSVVEAAVKGARHEITHRTSQVRSWRFEVGLLVAIVLAGLFAWLARTVAYLPLDVELTRALQSIENPWLETFFHAVAWIGFPPQSNVIFGAVVLALFLVGLRLEALMTLFAAVGSAGLWFWIVPIIDRPRPSPEMVRVALELPTGSFPSGHVLNLTAIFGFLIYLAIVLLAHARWRAVLVSLLAIPILTIGIARIYDGAHWPSDILGGYLIGGIWLGLTIQLYRWAKAHFSGSRHHHHDAEHPGRDLHPPDARQPA
jgi:undecaprenyl-diphosphatase